MIKEFFNNIPKVTSNYGFKLVTDEEFLAKNNISISKITYSYKFPYEITHKYKRHEKGSSPNEQRNVFLQSIYDRLLKLDGNDTILARPHYIIELRYLHKNKYYNININSERIIFNNIDFENTGELDIIVLNLIGFDLLEMGRYEHHNIVYKINFGSCYINKMIKTFNNVTKSNQTSHYEFIHSKKRWIDVYKERRSNQMNFKINLKGRNKLLIHQNTQNKNDGSINDLYKYIKSVIILPSLLIYLLKDKCSLFNYLPPEIVDIIIDMLYITDEKEVCKPYNSIKSLLLPFTR